MISILSFLFFIKQFFISSQKEPNYSKFNDKFTYIRSVDKTIQVYLGNELIFLNFTLKENSTDNKIYFENDAIIVTNNKDIVYKFNTDETKVYHHEEKIFFFVNDTCKVKFNFSNDLIINDNLTLEGILHNITSADAEYVFTNYYFFSYVLFIFGCYISSFGAIHNIIKLIIHSFFLIYFFFGDIISFLFEFRKYILYLFFALLLISVIVNILLKTKKKDINNSLEHIGTKNENISTLSLKKHWINGIYGATFGFCLFKTLIYYFINFGVSFDFDSGWKFPAYLSTLFLFIAIPIFLYLIDIFEQYRYLICSVVAGSFYIIKSVEYIIGGY